jgi:SagB-type dehydrogenase family enzyme
MRGSRALILFLVILCNMEMAMAGQRLIELPQTGPGEGATLATALQERRSGRAFAPEPLTLAAVGRLLWAAQGVTSADGRRTAPSAGALYPLELHLLAGRVDGLPAGRYRYDPVRHGLTPAAAGDRGAAIAAAALGQDWISQAAALVIVTAIEQRTTRKYGPRGTRYVHMEVGHASQNLLLQATALGLVATVVGAFDDDELARLLDLTAEERPLAILAVGHPRH